MEPIFFVLLGLALIAGVVGIVLLRRRWAAPPPPTAPSLPTGVAPAPAGLSDRLARSREALGGALRGVFSRGSLDGEFWEGMEEALVAADVGVKASGEIVGRVRTAKPDSPAVARVGLRRELLSALAGKDRVLHLERRPAVVVVVGVNGTGKTTTIAKLAANLRHRGTSALLGAADTFRAGGDAQLRTWADRVGVEVVGGREGADPAAVAFDAYQAGKARGRDVVIVDTAGRLHSKHNLMAELGKVVKVLERESGKIDEVLLVLDATTGQNGLAQVRQFTEAVGVTGIVLTKLDGTAKGGIVVSVERELSVPVKFIGVGEGVDDLLPFEPEAFVDALLADA